MVLDRGASARLVLRKKPASILIFRDFSRRNRRIVTGDAADRVVLNRHLAVLYRDGAGGRLPH
jgi:hypothetical protein